MRRLARGVLAVLGVGFAYLAYIYLTLPDVRRLATENPPTTAFIEIRREQAHDGGRNFNLQRRWVPYNRISNQLKRAVIVAEDSAFFEHEGLDYEQIRESIEDSLEDGGAIRGASTITQQLAKNLYLSESRDPVRKLRELLITRRLETALSKRRILEIYLNSIEWGDGIFGCEAAARTYFHKGAAELDEREAALLAGAIINPRVHNPGRPTRRLLRRQQIIMGRMGKAEPPPNAPAGTPEPLPPLATDPPPVPEDPPPTEPPPAEPPPAPTAGRGGAAGQAATAETTVAAVAVVSGSGARRRSACASTRWRGAPRERRRGCSARARTPRRRARCRHARRRVPPC
jgi:monofunctional glycosyltransferase